MTWQPLLPAPLAQRAVAMAEEIADVLVELAPDPRLLGHPVSLASGLAGRALFFAYLDLALPGGVWGDRAAEAVERAIDAMAAAPPDPSLFSGFTGLAWTLDHLRGWFFDESDDPGEEIAAAVEKVLGKSWSELDLLQGLTGVGVFALERLPRPGAEECLRRVVTRLGELARQREGVASWPTPSDRMTNEQRAWFPYGFTFTGVAHGAAGTISLLAAADAAGVSARPLLDHAVAWLLAQRLPPGAASVFPYETAEDGAAPDAPLGRPSRLAWCHGDPGIAAALLGAARRVGEPVWEREAIAVARHAAARSASEKAIVDAGLCHGSGGLLHLFNRMYQATGDPSLGEAARFWFDRTLALRRPDEGIAGFLAWDNDVQGVAGWRSVPGFLTGAAGTGLALLAAATAIEPAWDRVLQVSIPAARETPEAAAR
jgi:lantibiotic modifying enzyme